MNRVFANGLLGVFAIFEENRFLTATHRVFSKKELAVDLNDLIVRLAHVFNRFDLGVFFPLPYHLLLKGTYKYPIIQNELVL